MLKSLIRLLQRIEEKLSNKKKTSIKKDESGDLEQVSANSKFNYKSFFLKTIIVFLTLFLLGIFASITFLIVIFSYYGKDLPDIENHKITEESTKILDRDGDLLYEIHGDVARTIVKMEDISPFVEKATLMLEDKDFYNHPGFDWKGLVRVVFTHGYNFTRKFIPGLPWKQTVGGSTITQQLVKNTILSNERTIKRKIQELLLARNIEQKYTKKEILALYLNNIPYGGSTYGIEAAAQKYFGVSAKSLTLAQSATLAALPQSPTYLSPYGNNVEKLMQRKEKALREMNELGLIEELEYEDAKNEVITFLPFIEAIKHPHFVMYAKEELTKLLTEKYGEIDAEYMIENGGLTVKTTLNQSVQAIAESVVVSGIAAASKYNATNSALVAQDSKTGQILAMVGSVNFFDKDNDGQVNVALALRQPGSSIKPLIYTQAFIEGESPGTVVYDVLTDFGRNYRPNNYDGKFLGPVTFRTSLAQSRNVPAVKALYLAGITDAMSLAKRMGITNWDEKDEERCGLSLVLGGCEVRLIDMVQAYSVLNNLGKKYEQTVLLEVKNSKGEEIYKWELKEPETVIDEENAFLIVDIMTDKAARSPIFGSSLNINRNAGVKTGTTNSYLDAWTLGFVPQLVAGVWAGNNQPSEMKQGGSFVASPIWKNFMNQVLELPEYKQVETWARPKGIKSVEVSTLTGKIPNDLTPKDKIRAEIFSSTNTPTETEPLTMYQTAVICDPSGLIASEFCPEEEKTTLIFIDYRENFDIPAWQEPVKKWVTDTIAKQNEAPSTTIIDGKKIRYVANLEDIPVEIDFTYDQNSSEETPRISFENNTLSSLGLGTNVFKVNIEAVNELDQIEAFLDGKSFFKRKFIKQANEMTISIFIEEALYPVNSKHNLLIQVTDIKKLRGIMRREIEIKDDLTPPEIINFSPEAGSTIESEKMFNIEFEVSDNKSEIAKVELFLNGLPLKIFESAPYTYATSITNAPGVNSKSYDFTVRAYDKTGNITKETYQINVR